MTKSSTTIPVPSTPTVVPLPLTRTGQRVSISGDQFKIQTSSPLSIHRVDTPVGNLKDSTNTENSAQPDKEQEGKRTDNQGDTGLCYQLNSNQNKIQDNDIQNKINLDKNNNQNNSNDKQDK